MRPRNKFGVTKTYFFRGLDIIKKAKKNKRIFKMDVCNPLEFVLKGVLKND